MGNSVSRTPAASAPPARLTERELDMTVTLPKQPDPSDQANATGRTRCDHARSSGGSPAQLQHVHTVGAPKSGDTTQVVPPARAAADRRAGSEDLPVAEKAVAWSNVTSPVGSPEVPSTPDKEDSSGPVKKRRARPGLRQAPKASVKLQRFSESGCKVPALKAGKRVRCRAQPPKSFKCNDMEDTSVSEGDFLNFLPLDVRRETIDTSSMISWNYAAVLSFRTLSKKCPDRDIFTVSEVSETTRKLVLYLYGAGGLNRKWKYNVSCVLRDRNQFEDIMGNGIRLIASPSDDIIAEPDKRLACFKRDMRPVGCSLQPPLKKARVYGQRKPFKVRAKENRNRDLKCFEEPHEFGSGLSVLAGDGLIPQLESPPSVDDVAEAAYVRALDIFAHSSEYLEFKNLVEDAYCEESNIDFLDDSLSRFVRWTFRAGMGERGFSVCTNSVEGLFHFNPAFHERLQFSSTALAGWRQLKQL